MVEAVSSSSAVSVISSSRREAARPKRLRVATRNSGKLRSWNWTAEKLTATAASVGQADGFAAGLLEHPAADVEDEAGLLGDGDELGGRDVAARRVMPADQRLERGDLALRHGDDGLEGER